MHFIFVFAKLHFTLAKNPNVQADAENKNEASRETKDKQFLSNSFWPQKSVFASTLIWIMEHMEILLWKMGLIISWVFVFVESLPFCKLRHWIGGEWWREWDRERWGRPNSHSTRCIFLLSWSPSLSLYMCAADGGGLPCSSPTPEQSHIQTSGECCKEKTRAAQ